ncbi:MAG: PTS transporter subunit EIIC [Hespellia sp.]|nr:PTS transporter subunit EIIC [Hespellia sp.]
MGKQEIATRIVQMLGMKENLLSIENCMTRVRIQVKNIEKCELEKLKKEESILGINVQGNNVQLVVGPGKSSKIAMDISELTGIKNNEVDEAAILKQENQEKNNTPFKRILKKIAHVFIPILPAFIACGLMVAIYEAGYVFFPGLKEADFGKILSAIAYSVFTILPIIVGYNTAKEFGGSPILGAVLASILNTAEITGIHIFGIECTAGRGGVISVLIVAAVGAKLERVIRKKMPEILDTFLTPLITIFIMTFVGLIVFQPVAGFVSDAVGNFVQYIIYNVPALAGLATLVYLPLVMTGMHHGLIAVNAQLISDFGVTYLLPVTCMAGAGQVGAAFYVFLKTKNKRIKKVCRNALPVGMLGIGEPLMWGVTIPLGKPFIASCLGGAVGGSAMAIMHVAAKIPELSGLQLSLITTSPIKYLIGVAISYAAGFLFCMLLGFSDPEEE